MKLNLDELIWGSKHFRWSEALYLPSWNIHVFPTHRQFLNIEKAVRTFDQVREYIGKPMTVTSWLRPKAYNKAIKGAFLSAHREGIAMDFQCRGIKADRIREILEPVLEDFEIRMENLPGSNWVHIDCREPGPGGRFFSPYKD